MTIPGIPANTIYQTYTDIQMLQPPNQSTGDRYGCDIALSGNKNILLIGSQDEDGSAPSHDGYGTYNDDLSIVKHTNQDGEFNFKNLILKFCRISPLLPDGK